MSQRTIAELQYRQSLPLSMKVAFTKTRIREWITRFGFDGVYISYSGGKDSTVLSHIVDDMYPGNDIPRVFFDTGLEFPELRDFVKREPRAVWIKPEYTFKEVIEKYGYPFFAKETSEVCYQAKNWLRKEAKKLNKPDADLIELAKSKDKWTMPYRVSIMLGTFESYWSKKKTGLMPKDGKESGAKRQQDRYQFMLNAPFDISHMCCEIMKKNPAHKYVAETGRYPMTGEQASESKLRTNAWLKHGCNGFDLAEPKSTPMATWTEQDVLLYIKMYIEPPLKEAWANIYNPNRKKRKFARKALKRFNYRKTAICSVYGDIVTDYEKDGQLEGQVSLTDLSDEYGLFDLGNPPLKTTGCRRTGCMFCGYGCQLEKEGEGRFEMMKETHPKIYDYIMRPKDKGGLNYKEVIDWINENGNMNIKY